MKNLGILVLSMTIVGCSHANNTSQQDRENEIGEALTSRTLALADDISQSRRLYISAYNTINSKSEMNNELFIYTVRKIEALIGNYEVDNNSFENDIKANKNITLEAIDGLCIMNKFIQKYSTLIDLNKTPVSIQQDSKNALKIQPLYIERLSKDKDYLSQLSCLSLKNQS